VYYSWINDETSKPFTSRVVFFFATEINLPGWNRDSGAGFLEPIGVKKEKEIRLGPPQQPVINEGYKLL